MDLSPNVVLENPDGVKYTLRRELGEGAFGSVWKARTQDGLKVAIKIVDRDRTSVQKVAQEVRILDGLKDQDQCSPYVLCLFDFWTDQESSYIVTEYLSGYDLKAFILDVVENPHDDDPENLLNILKQIADGVDWIHSRGIAHRDLKPANIQIDPETLKTTILDFGFACYTIRKTSICRQSLSGTSSYLAPEIWNRDFQDLKKADIFALGVTFFNLVTGKKLFKGPTREEVKSKMRVPIDTGSDELDQLILDMTALDPKDRPDIEEVRDRLDQVEPVLFPILEDD